MLFLIVLSLVDCGGSKKPYRPKCNTVTEYKSMAVATMPIEGIRGFEAERLAADTTGLEHDLF
ncbi:MAG: hypothetical protein ONB44_11480 [candidate division KSB1 bacterium]|nr:hypothetical protein [candidate division KSB1 bacterium]